MIRLALLACLLIGAADKPGTPDASLTNTYWKLMELHGESVSVPADQREPSMVLHMAENRVKGHLGCNEFTGRYEVYPEQLLFESLVTTKKMCSQGMEQEQRYLNALGEVLLFSISGDDLVLYDRGQESILRFVAVYLP